MMDRISWQQTPGYMGFGVGGSQIPLPQDRTRRLFANAQLIGQQTDPYNTVHRSTVNANGGTTPTMTGLFGQNKAGNSMTQDMWDRNMSGGVTPGREPAMNAVQQARAQGQGGPPPGMGGRNPNDPKNAVLAAYPR